MGTSGVIPKKATTMDWVEQGNKLTRLYVFASFRDAMTFMIQAAEIAETLNHHPEWRNVYNKVWVDLTTHDVGAVTDLDYQLAQAMDKIASTLNSH